MSVLENAVDAEFRDAVRDSLASVRTVLDNENRQATVAGNDESHDRHTYSDKFALAEFVTTLALDALNNVIERLGLEGDERNAFANLASSENRRVTLRFQMSETCDYVGARSVEQNAGKHRQFMTSAYEKRRNKGKDDLTAGVTMTKKAVSHTDISRRTVHNWNCVFQYSLSVFTGEAPDEEETQNHTFNLSRQRGFCKVVTASSSTAPSILDSEDEDTLDLNLSWFLRHFNTEASPNRQSGFTFQINRGSESCRTPRRNPEVEAAVRFFFEVQDWAREILLLFHKIDDTTRHWQQALMRSGHAPSDSSLPAAISLSKADVEANGVFIPVLPLFCCPQEAKSGDTDMVHTHPSDPAHLSTRNSFILQDDDVGKLLAAQCLSLDCAGTRMSEAFPSPDLLTDVITFSEAQLVLILRHASSISECYIAGVKHIENLLRDQLAAAVGKHLESADFAQFVRFHFTRKLFCAKYKPEPFCHSIRRPLRYPDGVVTIVDQDGSPIEVISRKMRANSETKHPRFQININAATTVEIDGQEHLHGWMLHRFSREAQAPRSQKYQIVARAHQFSSVMLVLGKVNGPNTFDPQDAIIIQNKDEVVIPLLADELPSPKEFHDMTASLSPEQRRFAEAYRKMQLESSIFALCIVQIKPQLETLLGLPPLSLIKEIQLTQDILRLFIEYQIPCDLLAYDGDSNGANEPGGHVPSALERVDDVKEHVARAQNMIRNLRRKQHSEEIQRASADMKLAPKQSEREACDICCPRGHRAEFHFTFHSSFVCNVGNHTVPYKAPMYGCRRCDWDVCEYCHKRRKHFHDKRRMGYDQFYSSFRSTRSYEPEFRSVLNQRGRNVSSNTRLCKEMHRHSLRDRQELEAEEQARAHVDALEGRLRPLMSSSTRSVDSSAGVPSTQLGETSREKRPPNEHEAMMGVGEEQNKQYGGTDGEGNQGPPIKKIDVTQLPKQLDSQLEAMGVGSSVRCTLLKTGENWTQKSADGLLSLPKTTTLDSSKRQTERHRCLDLLDALSKSGSLPIHTGEVHMIMAATHSFDKSVVETVVQDNVNPLDKVEVSALLMGMTIHGFPSPMTLLKDSADAQRISSHSPALFSDIELANAVPESNGSQE